MARAVTPPQDTVKLELLVESIGGTNELGSRLYQWAQATAEAQRTGVQVARFNQAAQMSAWTGTLHVIYDGAANGNLTLPPKGAVPLDAVLTVTRTAAGSPSVLPAAGDFLAGGLNSLAVDRSAVPAGGRGDGDPRDPGGGRVAAAAAGEDPRLRLRAPECRRRQAPLRRLPGRLAP